MKYQNPVNRLEHEINVLRAALKSGYMQLILLPVDSSIKCRIVSIPNHVLILKSRANKKYLEEP